LPLNGLAATYSSMPPLVDLSRALYLEFDDYL
jgi:hypothetical protein